VGYREKIKKISKIESVEKYGKRFKGLLWDIRKSK